MEIVWMIIFMAFIGALIGGFTNHLAIKMLFRPHEAKYIGSFRIPFTPGLIPKRRDELAKQLGRTVSEHLLTPETFKRRFFSLEMKDKVASYVASLTAKHVFASPKSINDWLQLAEVKDASTRVNTLVANQVHAKITSLQAQITSKSIRELAPSEWQLVAEEKIPEIATYMLTKGSDYFASDEGKATIKRMLDDFLSSKGTFGGMIQMFMGDSHSIVERIQPELQKFMQAPGTFELIVRLIRTEWEKLRDRPISELVGELDLSPISAKVTEYIKQELAMEERLNLPLSHYWPTGQAWVEKNVMPRLLDTVFVTAERELATVIEKLQLEELVREQVDTFPVQRLEDLVLGISKREFKMITVLGAILGGLIGIIQGVIVTLFNVL
ncbi:DUF445 domain-containing protein [Paenisporosarcina cavernae]|uniref:DUF445 family protein n=1 Tax=Paenisporosarcina cavernae TaxID=2320858 RepID=A0A385YTH8_9BACL|nr:DUF445 family protein [Paenisporosarcina cavernae]AYC30185.1 DUF445 family protein [Paenisporosarcina cavernae]